MPANQVQARSAAQPARQANDLATISRNPARKRRRAFENYIGKICVKRPLLSASGFVGTCRNRLLKRRPEGEAEKVLAAALLILCTIYSLLYFGVTADRALSQPIGDFFGLWSAGHFLHDHPAAAIYDAPTLKSAQLALGMDPGIDYPFPYPPSFMLAMWPLGMLPLIAAYFVLIGISVVLFVWATAGRQWRSWFGYAALVAPATTITIIAGQAGLLAAALMAGAFRLAAMRPVIAGIVLGLLTYKPQFGILVPVALVAAGLWRTIAAAMFTLLGLVLLSGLIFGWSVWPAWATGIIAYSDQFAAESSGILHFMPTVFVALTRLGVAPAAAQLAQAASAIVAAGVVWDCFRRGATPLAGAALMTATFLATPHAFVYDMPIVATAVLWTVAEGVRSGPSFSLGERLVLILAFAAPITLPPAELQFPVAVVSLILLLALIARRCRRQHPTVARGLLPPWLSFRAAESP